MPSSAKLAGSGTRCERSLRPATVPSAMEEVLVDADVAVWSVLSGTPTLPG